MKNFGFFRPYKQIEIDFDENKSVRDLVKSVCKKYALKYLDCMTVYDSKNYHVVTDVSRSVKDENLSSALCFAYFVNKKFLYVEGSWGHHMIKMDAVEKIDDPFMFRLSLSGPVMHEYFVACKDYTVSDLYNGVVKNGFISPRSTIAIYSVNMSVPSYELVASYPIKDVAKKSVYSLTDSINGAVVVFEK